MHQIDPGQSPIVKDSMGTSDKVFEIERQGRTLILLPQGPSLNFRYQDIHLTTNEVYRILAEPEVDHLIVDLADVQHLDSIIISSILRLLTKAKTNGGEAIFCTASKSMSRVLRGIKIGEVWQYFPTRSQALAAIASVTPEKGESSDQSGEQASDDDQKTEPS